MSPTVKLLIHSLIPLILFFGLRKMLKSVGMVQMMNPRGAVRAGKQMTNKLQRGWGGAKRGVGKARGLNEKRKGRPGYQAKQATKATAREKGVWEDKTRVDNSDLARARAEGGPGYAAAQAAARWETQLERRKAEGQVPSAAEAADRAKRTHGSDYADQHLFGDDGTPELPKKYKGSVETGAGINPKNPGHWMNYVDVAEPEGFDTLSDEDKHAFYSAIGMTETLRNADGSDSTKHLSALTPEQKNRLLDEKGGGKNPDLTVGALVPRIQVPDRDVAAAAREFNLPVAADETGRLKVVQQGKHTEKTTERTEKTTERTTTTRTEKTTERTTVADRFGGSERWAPAQAAQASVAPSREQKVEATLGSGAAAEIAGRVGDRVGQELGRHEQRSSQSQANPADIVKGVEKSLDSQADAISSIQSDLRSARGETSGARRAAEDARRQAEDDAKSRRRPDRRDDSE